MSLQDLLDQERSHKTAMGKAFLCDRVVFRGKDLHQELGDKDWFSLYLFSITGKEYTIDEIKMLNYIWLCTSYPDPSIWPNHVTELAGNSRSTPSLSLMSGMAISEASIYGRRPDRRAISFLQSTNKAVKEGAELGEILLAELKKYRVVYGYGRPLARIDERILHTVKKAKELGFADGEHFQLALEVYRYLRKNKRLSMNVAALDAALCADMGMTPEQYQLFMTPCFIAGMVPCFIDGITKPEGSVFAMRCESIKYSGVEKRSW
ncbi:citrate/2-methylcitrate synthase [Hahella ganghwensis]|uniref:citrate/2-methylcitrate synthase n=1 Tax=Hahella ganghwensis TaxID=286420 RepID=UPI0003606703|nr:citrate/2-methylcitrate synthase [Hahella ganghwensis]